MNWDKLTNKELEYELTSALNYASKEVVSGALAKCDPEAREAVVDAVLQLIEKRRIERLFRPIAVLRDKRR